MLYRVVRPFQLSLDGFTLIDLDAGDEREDFGGMEVGLEAEGFIEPAVEKNATAEPQVVQPITEPVKPQQKPRRQR